MELNVWPQLQTYCRKTLSAIQIAKGGVTGQCAGVLFWKEENCSKWWISSSSDCQSQWLCADRKRVEKDVNKTEKIKKGANKAAPETHNTSEAATEFIKQNIVISGGFVGGLASSGYEYCVIVELPLRREMVSTR
ncbi:FUN14 domain-containing protein 1-like [Mustela erminea]|uniref:FUN14 domain-containing protein 1-like n=1 Tax=Mustela erminea TaxID=36723 RepID=UPI001386D428|nr:FUN14 domain-containing protein 1-like [Mustela erminea]